MAVFRNTPVWRRASGHRRPTREPLSITMVPGEILLAEARNSPTRQAHFEFGDVNERVNQIEDLSAKIASVGQEHSQGIDQVVQGAAANAEESAPASEQLSSQKACSDDRWDVSIRDQIATDWLISNVVYCPFVTIMTNI